MSPLIVEGLNQAEWVLLTTWILWCTGFSENARKFHGFIVEVGDEAHPRRSGEAQPEKATAPVRRTSGKGDHAEGRSEEDGAGSRLRRSVRGRVVAR